MWELFPPDPSKEKEGKRFHCVVLDRDSAAGRPAGAKRYREVMEDFTLGIRTIVEGNTKEETARLHTQEERKARN